MLGGCNGGSWNKVDSRFQASRASVVCFQEAIACSTGAKARDMMIEAATMLPAESS